VGGKGGVRREMVCVWGGEGEGREDNFNFLSCIPRLYTLMFSLIRLDIPQTHTHPYTQTDNYFKRIFLQNNPSSLSPREFI